MGGPLAGVLDRMDAALAALPPTDPGRHFLLVYRRTTVAVGEAVEAGRFSDPDWVVRWDEVFAQLYLDALEARLAGRRPSGPWAVAFSASADLPPLRHVLLGLNAHINLDLPQALIEVIPTEEFDDGVRLSSRRLDHARIDEVLTSRVGGEDALLRAGPDVAWLDHVLAPLNRAATRRFVPESRRRVWRNARLLDRARRAGPDVLAARVVELDRLATEKVARLLETGQVLLRLARIGFGVDLPER